MPATRTQVYLTPAQRERIDEMAASSGRSLAEIVRLALDEYLEDRAPNPDAVLKATFGALPGLEVPSRDEWDRG
ncbi:MAG TPA: CopG family transcriptional regulator [Thermoanaerobaculia bacterium]|jgi:hypothetical protein|nr:CopG family transcriptional regulator [Thermoanaerobaculia bacterium]